MVLHGTFSTDTLAQQGSESFEAEAGWDEGDSVPPVDAKLMLHYQVRLENRGFVCPQTRLAPCCILCLVEFSGTVYTHSLHQCWDIQPSPSTVTGLW